MVHWEMPRERRWCGRRGSLRKIWEQIVAKGIKIVPKYDIVVDLVGSYLKELGKENHLQILEAGCGRSWPYMSLGINYTLTGVDLDADALEFRRTKNRDLDRAIVGDIRSVALPDEAYDVIYCNYVLEHIQDADSVLRNFARWLRPGGLLIIAVPDPGSVSGFLTRFTPHWFHIWAYRYVKGYPLAGTPGHAPYRTYYDKTISSKGLLSFAADNNFTVMELCGYKNDVTKQLSIPFRLFQYFTLGTIRADYADIVFVSKKDKGYEKVLDHSTAMAS